MASEACGERVRPCEQQARLEVVFLADVVSALNSPLNINILKHGRYVGRNSSRRVRAAQWHTCFKARNRSTGPHQHYRKGWHTTTHLRTIEVCHWLAPVRYFDVSLHALLARLIRGTQRSEYLHIHERVWEDLLLILGSKLSCSVTYAQHAVCVPPKRTSLCPSQRTMAPPIVLAPFRLMPYDC